MPEFDPNKKFIHMQDNEDGTITSTLNLGEAFGGHINNVVIVQQGSIEDQLKNLLDQITPEQREAFESNSIIIPNEIPTD